MKVTLIGTLPQIKSLSSYCQELIKSLSKRLEVEFISFKKLYSNFLYLSGTKVEDKNYKLEIKNAQIRNTLTYYSPFSWVWSGVSAEGGRR